MFISEFTKSTRITKGTRITKVPVRSWKGLPIIHFPWLTTKNVNNCANIRLVVDYRVDLRYQKMTEHSQNIS